MTTVLIYKKYMLFVALAMKLSNTNMINSNEQAGH